MDIIDELAQSFGLTQQDKARSEPFYNIFTIIECVRKNILNKFLRKFIEVYLDNLIYFLVQIIASFK
jgi:hypothetical protein